MSKLADSRPLQVLDAAFAEGRLPHGILLHGDALEGVSDAAHALAAKLLKTERSPRKHPDFFALRPANKMRRIGVADTRTVIHDIQKTAHQGGRKVAVVYEADRLQTQAANAFLKTLEEPPADTTILLLTTRPYDLLPTIRSRCVNVRLPALLSRVEDADWQSFLDDYRQWLEALAAGGVDKRKSAALVMALYGFVSRFTAIMQERSNASWKAAKAELPEGLSDEELTATETGFRKGLQAQLLTELEGATRDFAASCLPVPAAQLSHVIAELERLNGLLAVNLNESTMLELFFLKSLRVWATR